MINDKIIIFLSLAAYVACGFDWFDSNAGDDDDNYDTVFHNEGGNKFTNEGGEVFINQGNLVMRNGQPIDNTNEPIKTGHYRTVFHNGGGNIFTNKGAGKDRQVINHGNYVHIGKKIDNTINSKGKQQTHKKSTKQETVKSNVQDQGVGIREFPSSSSNTKNSPTTNLELPGNAQTNNRDAIAAKPQTPMMSPEQVPIQQNIHGQESCSSGLYSSSSNTPNSCAYTTGGYGTTDTFEEGELVVFRVSPNDSTMYWMVIKKDGYYPEPNIDDLFYTIKPCQPDYQVVLEQLKASEIEGYVHYQYYGLHDEDELD